MSSRAARGPLVSVVVPVHNRETSLPSALRSIQAQSFDNWEVVVVDDASTDRSAAIASDFAQQDARFTLLRMGTNVGAQAARNAGIHASSADWVAFLDSDDEWFPSSLADRLDVARREQAAVVHAQCRVVRTTTAASQFDLPLRGIPPLSGMIYAQLLQIPGPMYQGMLVRREALERIGYLDPSIVAYQEWDTSLCLARWFTFGFVEAASFIYRQGAASSQISANLDRSARGYEQVVKKHAREIVRVRGKRVLAWHYRGAAARYLEARAMTHVARCTALSIVHWPFRNPLTPFVIPDGPNSR